LDTSKFQMPLFLGQSLLLSISTTILNDILYVTGFGKAIPVCARIEIHFIAYYNSHTLGLSRHSDTIAIDKKVCFYRQLFADPIKPCRTNSDPVGPLGYINRVTCGPKLFHLTFTLLVVWSGLLWPSVWPTVYTTWLPVSEGIVNPPVLPFHPPHPTPACPPLYLWHP